MRRRWIWITVLAVPVLLIGALAVMPWSVFTPLVESRVSAAIGRPVTIGDMSVSLGRITRITLDNVRIANPAGFDPDPPFAQAERVTLDLDTGALLRGWRIVLPQVEVARPVLHLLSPREGVTNYMLDLPTPSGQENSGGPEIGRLRILDGEARVAIAHLRAEMQARFATQEPEGGGAARIVAQAEGTYAGQPIQANFTGGALLALQEGGEPWPVELRIANGPTRASVTGTLRDPLALAGADVRLELEGPNMEQLTPLTGVPFPPTPRYRLQGRLAQQEGQLRLSDLQGRVGNSDIAGTVFMDIRGRKPEVDMNLTARRLDLADLAGFLGAQPGRGAQQATGRLIPDTPVSIPKLDAANVRLALRAQRIRGYATPIDNFNGRLTLRDTVIEVERVSFGIGRGEIVAQARLVPRDDERLQMTGTMEFRRVDLGRIMRSAGSEGSGAVSGRARIESVGRSTAELLARGTGGVTLTSSGGSLSALLVDLSGLRLGNAIFSAFGLPQRTAIECFVADFALQRGTLASRALFLETEDALISGAGGIEIGSERIEMRLRSESKRFTIAALPTSLIITGTLADPTVTPEIVELGIRGGIAAGLGIVAGPLAILPTIEFGIGDDPRCNAMLERLRQPEQRQQRQRR